MITNTITIHGMLQPDGVTVQLEKRVTLPPGRVTLTVQSASVLDRAGPTMVEVLDRIHRDQRARGCKPMTEEQMATEIAELRADDEEYEERCRQIWSQTGTQRCEGE